MPVWIQGKRSWIENTEVPRLDQSAGWRGEVESQKRAAAHRRRQSVAAWNTKAAAAEWEGHEVRPLCCNVLIEIRRLGITQAMV